MSPADTLMMIGSYPLKVSLGASRGRVTFDIRYHFQAKAGGHLLPGRRGVTIPVQALPEVIAALLQIKEALIADGVCEFGAPGDPPRFHLHRLPSNF